MPFSRKMCRSPTVCIHYTTRYPFLQDNFGIFSLQKCFLFSCYNTPTLLLCKIYIKIYLKIQLANHSPAKFVEKQHLL